MFKYTVHVPLHVPRIALGAYVRRAFPLLPDWALRDAFQARDVKMDGKRCAKDIRVPPGSEVTVYTACEMKMPVIYEDDWILALDKPAGISCDADDYGSMTVLDWAELHAAGGYHPAMCHRLDNQTNGLLVLAKNQVACDALLWMFQQHMGEKTYCCLVKGKPKPASDRVTAWLTKDAKRSQVRVFPQEVPGAKQIDTEYETIRTERDMSLLRVTLHTGRTHQIRAHLAYLGYPVAGDDIYGDRLWNRHSGISGLMLRSMQLKLDTQGKIPALDGKVLSVPMKLDSFL